MNTKKFNIGVIGCADIAKRHVIPAIISSTHFNLHSVGSEDPSKHMSFFNKNNIKFEDRKDETIIVTPMKTFPAAEFKHSYKYN